MNNSNEIYVRKNEVRKFRIEERGRRRGGLIENLNSDYKK
jgi:hypothetical protein